MKKIFDLKYILVILIIILTNTFNVSYSQNMDKFYEKIDLFSEVLEKIQDEYVDEVEQAEIKVQELRAKAAASVSEINEVR